MKIILMLCVLFLCLNCVRFKHLEDSKINFDKNQLVSKNIRFDGFFRSDKYDRIIFLKSKKILRTNTAIDEIRPEKLWFNIEFKDTLKSSFTIKDSLILGYLRTTLIRDRIIQAGNEDVFLNYEGTIKNSETISDWHLVPPFPQLNKKEKKVNKHIFEPRTLTFVKSDAMKFAIKK